MTIPAVLSFVAFILTWIAATSCNFYTISYAGNGGLQIGLWTVETTPDLSNLDGEGWNHDGTWCTGWDYGQILDSSNLDGPLRTARAFGLMSGILASITFLCILIPSCVMLGDSKTQYLMVLCGLCIFTGVAAILDLVSLISTLRYQIRQSGHWESLTLISLHFSRFRRSLLPQASVRMLLSVSFEGLEYARLWLASCGFSLRVSCISHSITHVALVITRTMVLLLRLQCKNNQCPWSKKTIRQFKTQMELLRKPPPQLLSMPMEVKQLLRLQKPFQLTTRPRRRRKTHDSLSRLLGLSTFSIRIRCMYACIRPL